VIVINVIFLSSLYLFYKYSDYIITSSESICRTSDNGSHYCRYKGKIEQTYVNSDGLALYFINEPFDETDVSNKEFVGVKSFGAVSLGVEETEINKEMRALLKDAFLENKKVELHMRKVKSGYLMIDRMWIKK